MTCHFILLSTLFIAISSNVLAAPKRVSDRPVKVFQINNFDIEVKQLPKGFVGLDAGRAFLALSASTAYGAKDKFESDADFQTRMSRAPESLRMHGTLTAASLVAIAAPIPVADLDFDANSGLTVWREMLFGPYRTEYYTASVEVDSTIKHQGKFQGQNAYGARAEVDQVLVVNNFVKMRIPLTTKAIESSGWTGRALHVAIPTSVSVAKNLLNYDQRSNFRYLFIGRLSTPYVETKVLNLGPATIETRTTGASITQTLLMEVSEIWLYRVTTGEIIGKQKI